MIRKLPADFVLGAAVAAGRREAAAAEERAFCAGDFYTHYREDIKRCQTFHIKALHISLAWTQIINEEGRANETGIRQYRALFEECLAHDIAPYVTLCDFAVLPASFPLEKREWLLPRTIEQFLYYAKVCFQAFGDIVNVWITMKDPVSLVSKTKTAGRELPKRLALSKAVHVLHKLLITHSRAVMLYKSMNFDGSIGIIHRAETVYPLTDSKAYEKDAFLDDAFMNRFLLDAVLLGSYSPKTLQAINEMLQRAHDSFAPAHEELACLREAAERMDFLGITYYASRFLPANVRDFMIFPHGLYDMLLRIHEEYPSRPLYIMENGLALAENLPPPAAGEERMVEDDDRIDYIRQHLEAVFAAREEGVDVRGYFVWSLLDAMPCPAASDDAAKRCGLFFVDFSNQKRYPKKSACWYRDLVQHRLMLTVEPISTNMLSY